MAEEKSFVENLVVDAGAKYVDPDGDNTEPEVFEYVGDRYAELEVEQESDEDSDLDEDNEPRA
jgi:hypothetical protein